MTVVDCCIVECTVLDMAVVKTNDHCYKCKKNEVYETVIGDVVAHLKRQKFIVSSDF